MIEIKFRGKTFGGKWVEGYYVVEMSTGKHKITDGLLDIDEVKAETIGQYTGMHDKNGKEIYEGDIVTMMRKPKKRQRRELVRHIVTCHNVCNWVFESLANEVIGLMMDNHSDFDSYKFDVVGNIFDNPELAQPYSLNLP